MAQDWTIGRKLMSGLGALVVLTLVGGAVAVWNARTLNATQDATLVAGRQMRFVTEIEAFLRALEAGQQEMIVGALTHDDSAARRGKATVDGSLDEIKQKFDALAATPLDGAERESIETIRKAVESWKGVQVEFESLIAKGQGDQARTLCSSKGQPILDTLLDHVERLQEAQVGEFDEQETAAEQAYSRSLISAIAIFTISLVVGVLVVFTVRRIDNTLRETASSLREGAEQVVAASSQVSTAAQALSQGATEQAASLEETSASMEEMASMTRKNAENSQAAAQLMLGVDQRVQESNRSLGDMVTSMTAIKESSDKVGRIIKTIDEIAFQTNILALNAAVEAARAGEAGMGFAVVADEVRNLAQRSAQAAKDTAGLIEESITRSTEGATKVQQVAGSIAGITEAVLQVKGLVEEVSVASREQSQGIDQVSQAVAQMEKVTQTTAATAEESAAASEELNAQAETSMTIVARLEAMVGRAAGVRAARPVGPRAVSGAKVVPMSARKTPAATTTRPPTAEEQIPLGDGTYGSF